MNKARISLEDYVRQQSLISRRELLQYITSKKVTVNGNVVSDLRKDIHVSDKVMVNGKQILNKHRYLYYKVNKPKGMLTTMDDPKGRYCIGDLIKELNLPLFPVGRLDRDSTGLIILTNDGDFSQRLSHPSYDCNKVYNVSLDKRLTKKDSERLLAGIILEDGPVIFKSCLTDEFGAQVTLSEGRNRIVRRSFESLGYTVTQLKRVSIAALQLSNLKPGKAKAFTTAELKAFHIK